MLQRVDHEGVRGVLHVPAAPRGEGIVLTHGAGANCEAPLLIALAEVFAQAGTAAFRCDLPFRQRRPQGPPMRGSAERDQQGLKDAVECLRAQVSGRVFLGGHSYGGRQASMLAATEAELVSGLLLLSYPLHPPQKPSELRTAHFPSLRTPALFVHGSRDGFGAQEEMREALALIPARTEILEVPAAGHELMSKRNAAVLPGEIVAKFAKFAGA